MCSSTVTVTSQVSINNLSELADDCPFTFYQTVLFQEMTLTWSRANSI